MNLEPVGQLGCFLLVGVRHLKAGSCLPRIPWDRCSSPYREMSDSPKGVVAFAVDVLGELVPAKVDEERST